MFSWFEAFHNNVKTPFRTQLNPEALHPFGRSEKSEPVHYRTRRASFAHAKTSSYLSMLGQLCNHSIPCNLGANHWDSIQQNTRHNSGESPQLQINLSCLIIQPRAPDCMCMCVLGLLGPFKCCSQWWTLPNWVKGTLIRFRYTGYVKAFGKFMV